MHNRLDGVGHCSDDLVESDRLAQNATHYPMNHRRRGVAAIFNQEHFEQSGVHDRRGSQRDCQSLLRSFSQLEFDVELYTDLTRTEILSTLQELSQRDHTDCDCFMLAFMSHGLEGKLRSKDAMFDVNLLWENFTAENSPTLANKPKIFFIQACQGPDRQKAVLIKCSEFEESPQDQVKLIPSYLLPDRADFLIALSTIPGFVSWRSTENGSWYIQTLCQHLDAHGFDQDILTLLTNVGRTVSLDFTYSESSSPSVDSSRKQLPSVISLLIRTLKFTRKGSRRKTPKRASRASLEDSESADEQSHQQISLKRHLERNEDEGGQDSVCPSPKRKRHD